MHERVRGPHRDDLYVIICILHGMAHRQPVIATDLRVFDGVAKGTRESVW
jgi:hypothetical protein